MTKETKLKMSIFASGFKCYEVANTLGVSACTLSVWLRPPISTDHEKRIREAVQTMREAKRK